MELKYVTAADVRDFKVSEIASGFMAGPYGEKIPTQFMVNVDNRWRRVYAVSFGNSASAYIIWNKARHYLDSELEHMLIACR